MTSRTTSYSRRANTLPKRNGGAGKETREALRCRRMSLVMRRTGAAYSREGLAETSGRLAGERAQELGEGAGAGLPDGEGPLCDMSAENDRSQPGNDWVVQML